MEAVFLVVTIAAKEHQDVAIIDIQGAFMQTSLRDERIHIKFERRIAEMLSIIKPRLYRQHIVVENGKPMLYAELRKVFYGMFQTSLKFWEQNIEYLVGLGFENNP